MITQKRPSNSGIATSASGYPVFYGVRDVRYIVVASKWRFKPAGVELLRQRLEMEETIKTCDWDDINCVFSIRCSALNADATWEEIHAVVHRIITEEVVAEREREYNNSDFDVDSDSSIDLEDEADSSDSEDGQQVESFKSELFVPIIPDEDKEDQPSAVLISHVVEATTTTNYPPNIAQYPAKTIWSCEHNFDKVTSRVNLVEIQMLTGVVISKPAGGQIVYIGASSKSVIKRAKLVLDNLLKIEATTDYSNRHVFYSEETQKFQIALKPFVDVKKRYFNTTLLDNLQHSEVNNWGTLADAITARCAVWDPIRLLHVPIKDLKYNRATSEEKKNMVDDYWDDYRFFSTGHKDPCLIFTPDTTQTQLAIQTQQAANGGSPIQSDLSHRAIDQWVEGVPVMNHPIDIQPRGNGTIPKSGPTWEAFKEPQTSHLPAQSHWPTQAIESLPPRGALVNENRRNGIRQSRVESSRSSSQPDFQQEFYDRRSPQSNIPPCQSRPNQVSTSSSFPTLPSMSSSSQQGERSTRALPDRPAESQSIGLEVEDWSRNREGAPNFMDDDASDLYLSAPALQPLRFSSDSSPTIFTPTVDTDEQQLIEVSTILSTPALRPLPLSFPSSALSTSDLVDTEGEPQNSETSKPPANEDLTLSDSSALPTSEIIAADLEEQINEESMLLSAPVLQPLRRSSGSSTLTTSQPMETGGEQQISEVIPPSTLIHETSNFPPNQSALTTSHSIEPERDQSSEAVIEPSKIFEFPASITSEDTIENEREQSSDVSKVSAPAIEPSKIPSNFLSSTTSDAIETEREQQISEASTREFHETMKQKAPAPGKGKNSSRGARGGGANTLNRGNRSGVNQSERGGRGQSRGDLSFLDLPQVGRPTAPVQEKTDPPQEYMRNLDLDFTQLMHNVRGFRGTVQVQVDFGRIILGRIHKRNLTTKNSTHSKEVEEMETLLKMSSVTTNFTKILTSVFADVHYLIHIKDGEKDLWKIDKTHWQAKYEFLFQLRGRDYIPFAIEFDAETFSYEIKVAAPLGSVFSHALKRHWDFMISAIGFHASRNINGLYVELAEALKQSLFIPPQSKSPAMTFHLSEELNSRFELHGIRVHKIRKFMSSNDQQAILKLSHIQDLDVDAAATVGAQGRLFKASASTVPVPSIVKLTDWYEVSILCPALDKEVEQNTTLEVGEEPSWTIKTMSELNIVKKLCTPAFTMIKQMDGVGYYNENGIDVAPKFTPPIATPAPVVNVNDLSLKSVGHEKYW